TSWSPSPSLYVSCFAKSGSNLYVGGPFAMISGQSRRCVAAFDLTTGALSPWDATVALGALGAQDIACISPSGSTLYLGGGFPSIGNTMITNLAAVTDATVGVGPEPITAGSLSLRGSPNPCSRSTDLAFALPRAERVSLQVYDVTGRKVASLAN